MQVFAAFWRRTNPQDRRLFPRATSPWTDCLPGVSQLAEPHDAGDDHRLRYAVFSSTGVVAMRAMFEEAPDKGRSIICAPRWALSISLVSPYPLLCTTLTDSLVFWPTSCSTDVRPPNRHDGRRRRPQTRLSIFIPPVA